MNKPTLALTGHQYSELFHAEGIQQLDDSFLRYLQSENNADHQALLAYRTKPNGSTPEATSELLIRIAACCEKFIIQLFKIEHAAELAQIKTTSENPLALFKKYFILKRAKKEHRNPLANFKEINDWLIQALASASLQTPDTELAIALLGSAYLEQAENNAENIEKLVQWCRHALVTDQAKLFVANWSLFKLPERIDYDNLVPSVPYSMDTLQVQQANQEQLRERQGFKLSDERMDARAVQNEVNYCIFCHDHQGDFCSKGFPQKKGDPSLGFKKNPLDVLLTGCPLEEKISEAHFLKQQGLTIAALIMVMIDNPMCPATGHRICNDCMKACIYQKQDPVNVPQIETRILNDVLALPWGVEIYDLLTRWNPLRTPQWSMKPYNGLKVLIAGMGPAGFTLAHHLLLEGFAVVGFDGLKIEPLSKAICETPIYSFDELKEALDERIMMGFGGVAEYGITVRWDKNFLKLIYLSLARKPYFQVFGNVRFGGTLVVEDAWKLGFDHFVIAVGAGLPKALPVSGSLAPGMRQANDFLMALQLNNAAKLTSLSNLHVRLPAVIIGGGLTGVDAATETQAYYIQQIEKILTRYEALITQYGQDEILKNFSGLSAEMLQEALMHAYAVRAERTAAKLAKRIPRLLPLLHQWGGVTIAYRRSMQESPAYINNHEELKNALAEGIFYAEGLDPASVELDNYGHAKSLICRKRIRIEKGLWQDTEETVTLAARTVLVATGTQPNTAYEFEHKGTFNRLNLQYQHYEDEDGTLTLAASGAHCKEEKFGAFTSYQQEDKRVSLVGDTHPVFHGNVVKAIASGLKTYPKIVALLKAQIAANNPKNDYELFAEQMRYLFQATVTQITRLNHNTLELVIKAPLAAKHFQAGQFFRLQNYETYAKTIHSTLLQMEPLSLLPTGVDANQECIHFLVREMSTAEKLCQTLKPGEPVSLMGPTGVEAKAPNIPETIFIIGNVNSFAFLLAYGKALRANNSRVIYLVRLESAQEIILQEKLEAASDAIIWNCAEGSLCNKREQDFFFARNMDLLPVLEHYRDNSAGLPQLADVTRVYIVGDTQLLREVQSLRPYGLKEIFSMQPNFYGSVYGNMQCMLKGVCAQCLQWQINPETGLRTKAVFACSWQDQPLELIDIEHLSTRKQPNEMCEMLHQLWLDHIWQNEEI